MMKLEPVISLFEEALAIVIYVAAVVITNIVWTGQWLFTRRR